MTDAFKYNYPQIKMVSRKFCDMDINAHCIIAFVIRMTLVLYGYVQDEYFEVKYTDIDYQVLTDGAEYVMKGLSPFNRHTYRYTPFLAMLLTPNIFFFNAFGKILFCGLDILASLLIYNIQKNFGCSLAVSKLSTFLWLYNPLSIIISTRGNAESVMVVLVMLSIYLYQSSYPFLFGCIYGVAIHVKIYPCIYAVTFYSILTSFSETVYGLKKLKTILYPNRKKCLFVTGTIIGFAIPTIISIVLYGDEYVHEALLYHVTRKDIRHNFSPYFYILYLSEAVDLNTSVCISAFAFFIQAALIAFVSWVLYLPKTLPACLFLETFIFVSFNKVCTSQYFLWYLCLLPLNYQFLVIDVKYVFAAFLFWICGQGFWLLPAYLLEFRGKNTFLLLFLCSLIFFMINIFLISAFVLILSNLLSVAKSDAVNAQKMKSL
ncbi:GPI mannosyltransferase 1-like [Stegodyphus dumicola]|uniref:GPI mannosyltransferase 1-like n=1 Tax=Stegodyphus dumicola TaxID=202533 RepID=UPI0015B1466E|nr:GPI mannosyltransferase 1-like [Stegodyphus dumicola]